RGRKVQLETQRGIPYLRVNDAGIRIPALLPPCEPTRGDQQRNDRKWAHQDQTGDGGNRVSIGAEQTEPDHARDQEERVAELNCGRMSMKPGGRMTTELIRLVGVQNPRVQGRDTARKGGPLQNLLRVRAALVGPRDQIKWHGMNPSGSQRSRPAERAR